MYKRQNRGRGRGSAPALEPSDVKKGKELVKKHLSFERKVEEMCIRDRRERERERETGRMGSGETAQMKIR